MMKDCLRVGVLSSSKKLLVGVAAANRRVIVICAEY